MLGFRVWHMPIPEIPGHVGRMQYYEEWGNEFIPVMKMSGAIYCYEGLFGNGFYLLRDVIPMQSTGISDMNGKKIFEGDILEYYTDEEDDPQFMLVETVSSFLLKAGRSQACMEYEDELDFSNCVTVIGNTYENPELKERINK